MEELSARFAMLEKKFSESEALGKAVATQLDHLITQHNLLAEKYISLVKSHNNCFEEIGHEINDMNDRITMLMDKVTPEQKNFDRQLGRVFNAKSRKG